jgi:hypothetical protein
LEEIGLATDATVSFGYKDIAFSRSALFKAIRSAFKNTEEEFYLEDVNGNSWSLRHHPGERPAFSLSRGGERLLNHSFWPLCNDADKRFSLFETEAKDRSLSKDEWERWGQCFRRQRSVMMTYQICYLIWNGHQVTLRLY